ncbi:DUF2785 domain-containing protein [Oceanobacillus bengalensis]|uniref:DUF2785 domain-containing protein n=1 Tax=Oceanobacillus bengalensis TaxID=1435466 RepID=A0A494YS96_9BACI|nr:DUF2785 domain-containing protein [Oceanobacillus bengalensis]RKQ12431.1 DUF2785 domain-containing protein [Oceanobacillus bengalensis]
MKDTGDVLCNKTLKKIRKNGEIMILKSELENLDTTLQHSNLDQLIDRMLDNIGSVDSELRDTLIFNTFGSLILEDYLTKKQMEHILEDCLSYLFLDIGQKESDSVFTRSFSALVIGLILEKDRQQRFLSDDVLIQVFEESITYLRLENDIRGYVKGKGWAHSIAHGADLLTEAIRHPHFNIVLSSKCLEIIKICLFKESTSEAPYVDDEEERLIFAVEALMEKGLTDSDIAIWVLSISNELKELLENEGYRLSFFWKRTNVVNFLRGFYFRLLYKNDCLKLQDKIVNILEQWHNKLYNLDQ